MLDFVSDSWGKVNKRKRQTGDGGINFDHTVLLRPTSDE